MAKKELDVLAQSKAAYNQWKEIWRKHASEHARFAPFKPLSNFMNTGIGRALICVANGYSLEREIETLKQHKNDHDVMCCDKSLGLLLEHGIKPKFCIVCDANVDYEKYMKPWEDQLDETVLCINVCGNTKWSFNGNWKDKYFFVNFDVLETENEFSKISGCQNQIPAATNVSGAMVVFVTQSDNTGRRNYFGYDKILLLGFDYSWKPDGSYYAFDKTANGKHNYMRHMHLVNRNGDLVFTSSNLFFSAQWLEKYMQVFNLPIVNCSMDGILGKVPAKPLSSQLPYNFRREDQGLVADQSRRRAELKKELADIEGRIVKIGEDHWKSFVLSTHS